MILEQIDNTPFGARIIAATDKCLGLVVTTNWHRPGRIASSNSILRTAAEKAYEPYLAKVEKRATALVYQGGVTHYKFIDWQLFTLSKLYYVASQYRPTPRILHRLNQAQANTLYLGPVIARENIQPVLRAIGMTAAKNIKHALEGTLLKAAIRQYGHDILVSQNSCQQAQAAADVFHELRFDLIGPEAKAEFLKSASTGSIKTTCIAINKAITLISGQEAREIAIRSLDKASRCWTSNDDNVAKALDLLNGFKSKVITYAHRLTWLKWFRFYDIDDWKRKVIDDKPKITRNKKCGYCDNSDPLMYPEGMLAPPRCQDHYPYDHTCFIDRDLAAVAGIMPATCAFPYGNELAQCPMPSIRTCPLCRKGESHVRHWVYECPIIFAACRMARIPTLDHLFHIREIERTDFARTFSMLHVVRLKLIRDGAIGKDRCEHSLDPSPRLALDDILKSYARYTHNALLSGLRIHQTIGNEGNGDHDNNGLLAVPAPHGLNFVAASKPITVTAKKFACGMPLYRVTTTKPDSPSLARGSLPIPEPIVVSNNGANAEWKGWQEADDVYHYILYAVCAIPSGAPILVSGKDAYVPEGNTILARFDGSCKKSSERNSCGGGIVVYLASNESLTKEVSAIAVPFPQADDSMSAEALAAARACTEAVALKRFPQYSDYKVIIQGDNKPIIDYWRNCSRLNSIPLYSLFQPIINCIHAANIDVQWQHIPREHNPVADALANQGADVVANGSAAAVTDANGDIIRPSKGAMCSPFEEDRAPFHRTDAVNYLQDVARGKPPNGTLWLPEQYRINNAELCKNIPGRDIPSVLKFLRQRRNIAQYTAAIGNEAMSRHYARDGAIAGSGITRITRFILLSDHFEADIASCFHLILRSFAGESQGPLLRDTAIALEFIANNLHGHRQVEGRAKAAKAILQRIITTDAEALHRQIRNEYALDFSPELLFEIRRTCEKHRPAATCKLIENGYVGSVDPVKINVRNRSFFAFEAAETAIMTKALAMLLSTCNPLSVVWLHDGMYVHNTTGAHTVVKVIQDAATSLGFLEPRVKITNCAQEAERGLREAPARDNSKLTSDILRAIDEQDIACDALCIDPDKPLGRLRTIFCK